MPRYDMRGRILTAGATVNVPEPGPDDMWQHGFTGTVAYVRENGLVRVDDMDGDGWDIEPERLEAV